MNVLPHITLESGPSPQYAVIWLHGLGADGSDFVPVAQSMRLPFPVRYIFPHAPAQPVSINGGYVMPAWYDIAHTDLGRQPDEIGLRTSQAEVEKLISQEIQRGIPADRIFLAGFSQGGAVVLQTGLRHAHKLGGILALSTYLPLPQKAATELSDSGRQTPVFMAHGEQDPIIALTLGKISADNLSAMGLQVSWHVYPMPHSVCDQEIRDIESWLGQHMHRPA